MNPTLLTVLIENGVLVVVGIWLTLLGYRIVGHKPGANPTNDAWFKKHGWMFRWGGPVMIVGNLLVAVSRLAK